MVGTLIRKVSAASIGITTGTYTPTLTNVLNLDASTANVTGYFRIADRVTVFGLFAADATAAASTATTLGMSLPVASNLAAASLAGTAAFQDGTAIRVLADATNDRAQFDWASGLTINANGSFIFAYQVL